MASRAASRSVYSTSFSSSCPRESASGPPKSYFPAHPRESRRAPRQQLHSRPRGAIHASPLRRRQSAAHASFAQEWDIDGRFARRSSELARDPFAGPRGGPQETEGRCLLQAFSWTSHRERDGKSWYQLLTEQADEIAACGFTDVILPPCSESKDPQGFSPTDFYNTDSAYGSSDELRALAAKLRQKGVSVGLEVVVSRGFGQEAAHWRQHWNTINEGIELATSSAPDGSDGPVSVSVGPTSTLVMDHSNPFVEADCKGWLLWLQQEYGFSTWRFDLAKNLDPSAFHSYCQDTQPAFAIADVWKAMRYNGPELEYDQDQHREELACWVKAAKGSALVMDYTTKGILQAAVERGEYWRLIDPRGNPPGLLGLMPSAALTFVDNHFTGSEQQWWPFPSWGIMVGYSYILTHPGLPCVLHDHLYDWKLKDQIRDLVQARKRNGIGMLSEVKIMLCSPDIYVARVGSHLEDDERFRGVVLKIGPSMNMQGTCPDARWKVTASGPNYCVWDLKDL